MWQRSSATLGGCGAARPRPAAETTTDLLPRLGGAVDGESASFASGVLDGEAAVRAAIVEPWSDGRTERHVTKRRLVEPQMHGRGEIDLLRARTVQPG